MEAYPLQWPEGWPRENGKETSRFERPAAQAFKMLHQQIARMGGSAVVISTNLPLKVDGTPRLDREPVDPGVAVHFTRKGKQMAFACDRFDVVRDNLTSIAKTIEALRGIERWGASDMMERAFSGFKQLTAGENWWDVLGVQRDARRSTIQDAYRDKAIRAHPDHGGSQEAMSRINVAYEQAKTELA